MLTKIGYIYIVDKGRVAAYFERNYLKYQMDNGRISLTKFAEIFRFSRGFLSQLMEGRRTSMTYHTALFVAVTLNDYEIMDILGYERPGSFSLPPETPAGIRSAFAVAIERILQSGLTFNSDEALTILTEELSKVAPKDTTNNSE